MILFFLGIVMIIIAFNLLRSDTKQAKEELKEIMAENPELDEKEVWEEIKPKRTVGDRAILGAGYGILGCSTIVLILVAIFIYAAVSDFM